MQKHLLYITKLMLQDINSSKIRGLKAVWNEDINTANLSFFLDGEATEEELEDYSVVCTEIIAHCSNALLEENYIRLDYPKPLPESPYWAYKREESIV